MNNLNLYLDNLVDQGYDINLIKCWINYVINGLDVDNYGHLESLACSAYENVSGENSANGIFLAFKYEEFNSEIFGFDDAYGCGHKYGFDDGRGFGYYYI